MIGPIPSTTRHTDGVASLLLDPGATTAGGGTPPRALPALRKRGWLSTWFDKRFYAVATIPALIVVSVVVAVPLAIGVYLSFTNYGPTDPSFRWAGLVNYRMIWDDGQVHTAIANTFIFAGVGILVQMVLGLGLALLLSRRIRGMGIFRVVYMVPLMVPGVAAAVTWSVLFNDGNGWINYFLSLVGLPSHVNWTGNAHLAMPTVLIASSWNGIAVVAIILLAGLLALPKDPYEAARIDGASGWRVLVHITLPGLRPVIAFAALFQLVNLFREFALFLIVTGGGPGLATNVINYYVWQQAFQFGSLGQGAALALLLVGMMAIPLLVIFRLSRGSR
jgi:multiple sugar transport system permease protein